MLAKSNSSVRLTHTSLGLDYSITNINAYVSDTTLSTWGEAYGFCRGFPVVWHQRDGILTNGGFHPKFNNDNGISAAAMAGALSIQISRKWSGYLSGLVLYRVDGDVRSIVVSKHSAAPDSPYVERAARLWEAALPASERLRLVSAGVCSVWAECLARFDQTHGSTVSRDHLHPIAIRIRGEGGATRMADAVEMDALLRPTRLALDPILQLETAATIAPFVAELSLRRDNMTESVFAALLETHGLPSKSLHSEILGDVLEGLVVRYETAEGEVGVLKYKFPEYGVRTFLLRELLRKRTPLGRGPDAWRPTRATVDAIEAFVGRWVFEDAHRPAWRQRALEMIRGLDQHHQSAAEGAEEEAARWIRAADNVAFTSDPGLSAAELRATASEGATHSALLLVVVLGPIGSGKSTAGAKLAALLRCTHVDGDVLLGRDARSFGPERNVSTFSSIAIALSRDARAVVSTGGGALGSGARKWSFDLMAKLAAALPDSAVRLVTATPSESWTLSATPPDAQDLEADYLSDETAARVEGTVTDRIARGEWAAFENAAKRTAAQSKKNLAFCRAILAETTRHLTFPHATRAGHMDDLPSDVARGLLEDLCEAPAAAPVLLCNQLRVIYQTQAVQTLKHETVVFSTHAVPVSVSDLEPLPDTVEARLVRVGGPTGCSLYVLPDRRWLGQTLTDQHLTLEPGRSESAPRRPATMRTVARAIIEDAPTVEVNKGDVIDLRTREERCESVRPIGWVVDCFSL